MVLSLFRRFICRFLYVASFTCWVILADITAGASNWPVLFRRHGRHRRRRRRCGFSTVRHTPCPELSAGLYRHSSDQLYRLVPCPLCVSAQLHVSRRNPAGLASSSPSARGCDVPFLQISQPRTAPFRLFVISFCSLTASAEMETAWGCDPPQVLRSRSARAPARRSQGGRFPKKNASSSRASKPSRLPARHCAAIPPPPRARAFARVGACVLEFGINWPGRYHIVHFSKPKCGTRFCREPSCSNHRASQS